MKKFISILLACSMILLSAVSVFATEAEEESYDLSELFADYKEYSLSEMVSFIEANPKAYRFVEFFHDCSNSTFVPVFHIHMAVTNIRPIHNVFDVGFTNLSPKYLTCTSRVTTSGNVSYDVLIGDVGNKVMSVELEEGFIQYVNSLERVEKNKTILNFLMNVIENEAVAGVSWAFSYIIGESGGLDNMQIITVGDCNGDGFVNPMDSNLMRKAVAGKAHNMDPFAVDINGDGAVNAKDSLFLKKMIANS